MQMLNLFAAALLAGSALAQSPSGNSYGQCWTDAVCSYSTTDAKGNVVSFSLRRLCRPQQDYTIEDTVQGHTFNAQICGNAAAMCLPKGYLSMYQFGSTVQYWGTTPACDNSCVDPRTSEPTCCTSPCTVTGIQSPSEPGQFSLVVPGDPTQGIRVTLFGETPTKSDPFKCDYDPVSGAPYPRVTHQEFYCDPSVTGFATLYEVVQNATDSCDYTLKFKTSAACVVSTGLGAGWIFDIVVLLGAGLYLGLGALWVKRSTGSWDIPHRAFWSQVDELVLEGLRFIFRGCKKNPNAGAGQAADKGALFEANGGALSSPGLKGSPFVGTSSSSSGGGYNSASGDKAMVSLSVASPARTPGGSSRSGYQAIGTPGGAGDSDL